MTDRTRAIAHRFLVLLQRRHPRVRLLGERGVTLVEVLLAGAFTVVVLAIAGGIMVTTLRAENSVTRSSNMSAQAGNLTRDLSDDLSDAVLVQTDPKKDAGGYTFGPDDILYLSAFVVSAADRSEPNAEYNDEVTTTKVTGTCKAWAYVPDQQAVFVREATDPQQIESFTGVTIAHPVPRIVDGDLTGWRRIAGGTIDGTDNPDVASIQLVDAETPIFAEQQQSGTTTQSNLRAIRLDFLIEAKDTDPVTINSRFSTSTALAGPGATVQWGDTSCLAD